MGYYLSPYRRLKISGDSSHIEGKCHIELIIEITPEDVFGVNSQKRTTFPVHHRVEQTFNANVGSIYFDGPLIEKLTATHVVNARIHIRLDGNKLKFDIEGLKLA